jgi:RecA-family ATPase
MELAIALAEGTKWLGFQFKKSNVLYMNMEINSASVTQRLIEIYKASEMEPKHDDDLIIWNPRGYAMPLDELALILIRREFLRGYDTIIVDLIYKGITGDENNASDIGVFTNLFDKICKERQVAWSSSVTITP